MTLQINTVPSSNQEEGILMQLDRFYLNAERKFFNPVGYFPLIGTLSAGLRTVYSISQIAIGIVGTGTELSLGLINFGNKEISAAHYDGAALCTGHIVHGILNNIRSGFEAIPLLPLLTCLPLDLSGISYSYRSA